MTRLTTASNLKETDKSNNNLSSNVQVVVRVRPLNEKESQSSKSIIKVVDDRMLTFDPKEELLDCLMSSNKNRNSILDKKQKDINYVFDFVFGETSSNRHVFENTTKEIIEDILKGYNCSVFAYGATSAGKTHTMLGSAEEPGVIFLTMMELYKRLMEKEEQFETDISVSYLEIYNETCKDLLLPTGPLSVREDPNKKVVVNGLSLHKPRSPEELLDMLHFGNQNRSQHPTDANKQSSRSHAVFQVFVKQCPKDAGLKTNVIYAKISLIDLAGSERATVTTNRGDRLREGANINKSLLALGNCINALAENKSNVHIPYRNSKLTRLLKDSLGGNCKTVMIAAVSPSSLSHEDTHNTLKYANRAKNIKSTLHTNTISVDFHVSQYAQIVKDLQAQIGFLNEKLSKYEQSENESSITEEDFSTLKNFEEKLSVLYGEKRQFKQNLIDIEAMEKVLKLKLLQKERSYERFSIVQKSLNNNVEENDPMVGSSFAKLRQATSLNLSKLEEQKKMLDSALMLNQEKIRNLHSSVDSWANSKSNMIRAYVNLLYNNKASELEKVYLACQVKQMRKYFNMVEAERENGYSLAEELCAIIRNSSTSGTYHSDEIAELLARHKQKNLLSTSKVVWADDDTDQKKSAENLDMTNLLQFQCVTPFRTPSRRPSSLRQAVLSARKTEGTSQEREMLTKQNTLRNAGPVRDMRTCLKKRTQSAADAGLDEKNATFTRSRSFSSTDQSPYGEKTFAYPSNTQSKRRIEFDQFLDRNKNENVEQVVARDDDCFINQNDIDTLDSTYLVGASLKQLSTENKNSVERINKSQIPMRAPLKTKNRETTPLSRATNYRSKYLEDSPLDKTYQVSDQRQESLVVRNIPVRGKPALSMKENFPVIRNVKNKKSRELLRYSIGPSKYFR